MKINGKQYDIPKINQMLELFSEVSETDNITTDAEILEHLGVPHETSMIILDAITKLEKTT